MVKSLKLHKVEGTHRRSRHRPLTLRPGKAPRPPKWLTALAREKWVELAKQLAELGVLGPLDHGILASYCEVWATWRNALDTIAQEGATFTTTAGMVKRHPSVAIGQQAVRDLAMLANQLGLTPAARLRLRIDDMAAPAKDAMDELLDG